MEKNMINMLKNTESFNKFYSKSMKYFGPRFATDVKTDIKSHEGIDTISFKYNSHEEVNGGSFYIADIREIDSKYIVLSRTGIKCFLPFINKTIENLYYEDIEEIDLEKLNDNNVKQIVKV